MSRRGACPFCNARAETNEEIFKHMEAKHKEELGDLSAPEVHYAFRNHGKPPRCHLSGCDGIPKWNIEKGKPDYFCSEECRREAGRRAKKNHMRVYGTEHNLNDPERQIQMQDNRSISGTYLASDGTTIPYMGKAELECVSILDSEFGLTGDDIGRPLVYFEYEDDTGRTRMSINDYELYNFACIIEVKEKLGNKNGHPGMEHKHQMDKRKEEAIIKSKTRHYIRFHVDDLRGFMKAMREVIKRNGKVGRNPIVYAPEAYYSDVK